MALGNSGEGLNHHAWQPFTHQSVPLGEFFHGLGERVVRGGRAREGRGGRLEINCLLARRFMLDLRVALLYFHSVGIYLGHVVSI